MVKKPRLYPEGYFIGLWIGIGIAIFAGVGVSLSIALNLPGLIGIWPAMGVAIGVAIGVSIEEKYRKDGRIIPRRKLHNNDRKVVVIAGVIVFSVLAAMLAFRFLL